MALRHVRGHGCERVAPLLLRERRHVADGCAAGDAVGQDGCEPVELREHLGVIEPADLDLLGHGCGARFTRNSVERRARSRNPQCARGAREGEGGAREPGVPPGGARGRRRLDPVAPDRLGGTRAVAALGCRFGSPACSCSPSGVGVLLEAFARFVVEGLGTPAPVAPTERLVLGGLYRYVRNPMYLAVGATIVGQALLLGQPILLLYAAAFALAVAAFVRLVRGADATPPVRRGVRALPACGARLVAAPPAVEPGQRPRHSAAGGPSGGKI